MLGHDLRYAFRTLARNPGFTSVSVLALALGIGANSAIFTVVNSVLLEPLHFYKAHQLVQIRERILQLGFPEFAVSPGNYQTYRDDNHSFSGITAGTNDNMNYVPYATQPERLRAFRVTSNFFDVLHTQPALGRGFTKQESEMGSQHVVILSYGLWQRRFAGRRDVLGQRMNLSGEMYDVVGVMPKEFDCPGRTDLWRPLAMSQADWQQRGGHYLRAIGRMRRA